MEVTIQAPPLASPPVRAIHLPNIRPRKLFTTSFSILRVSFIDLKEKIKLAKGWITNAARGRGQDDCGVVMEWCSLRQNLYKFMIHCCRGAECGLLSVQEEQPVVCVPFMSFVN